MALYHKLFNKVLELTCTEKLIYKTIDQTAVLDRVMRQSNNNTKNTVFRSALIELYNNTIGKST